MRRFISVFLGTVVIFFAASISLNFVANKLVLQDRFKEAKVFYEISKVINPFNEKATQGITIAEAIIEERKGESEETAFKDAIAQKEDKYVLAASVTVPVLMYHYIRYNPNPADRVGFNLSVTPNNFNAQIEYLSSHGYNSITLDDLAAAMLGTRKLPSKPVVITFDDGYKDLYTTAFPILKSHGLKAVSFVITGFVEGPGFLSWSDIDDMKGSGFVTFESHTVNHVALTYGSDQSVTRELTQSKAVLSSHIGYPVNWIAYPYGNVNPRVANLTKQAGYVGAFGTNFGSYQSTSAMFTLPRIRVGGSDTVASLASKLPY